MFRDALKNSPLKNVNTTVHQAGNFPASLLRKPKDSTVRVDAHSSVAVCILHIQDSNRRHCVVASMKRHEVMEINFKKRVTVHHQEFRIVFEIARGKFYSTCGAEGLLFLGVFNRNVPSSAITEFMFNLFCQVARTHHQPTDSLRTQLANQQMKEGFLSDRCEHLGRRWYCGTQSCSQSTNQENGFDVAHHVLLTARPIGSLQI